MSSDSGIDSSAGSPSPLELLFGLDPVVYLNELTDRLCQMQMTVKSMEDAIQQADKDFCSQLAMLTKAQLDEYEQFFQVMLTVLIDQKICFLTFTFISLEMFTHNGFYYMSLAKGGQVYRIDIEQSQVYRVMQLVQNLHSGQEVVCLRTTYKQSQATPYLFNPLFTKDSNLLPLQL